MGAGLCGGGRRIGLERARGNVGGGGTGGRECAGAVLVNFVGRRHLMTLTWVAR